MEAANDITAQVICDDITSLMKYFKTHMADLADTHGLTSIQLYALSAMSKQGSSMGHLAQTLHCDASNVTGIVDRLSALNLITRQENPLDRRVKTLQLTAKGQKVLGAITSELPGRLNCTALTAPERTTLHQLINKLNPTNINTHTGK
jgi:DNA-binding MarR family transcriptional regulator